ncbi:hypothetical protein EYV94_27885 [Puteibacter caeruleilacunae]|nr:hypothetical protein EYV94_27885 [Puteibacter caeruleilacunae]
MKTKRITNALLLKSSFTNNLGLLNGRMGISIYFFHLAKIVRNEIYQDYAEELIDEIYEEINSNTPCDFENGLAGIGWGIEYLVQNNFIDADTDEVLEEFDDRIIHELKYHSPDSIGIKDGLVGLGMYFLKRKKDISDVTPVQARVAEALAIVLKKLKDTINRNETIVINLLKNTINKTDTQKEHLCWDYYFVMTFLAGLKKEGFFINNLLEKLLVSLNEVSVARINNGSKLLLLLALEHLQTTLSDDANLNNRKDSHVMQTDLINKALHLLTTNISHQKLMKETFGKNSSLEEGCSGIIWIYQQLYKLSQKQKFLDKSELWRNKIHSLANISEGPYGIKLTNQLNPLGVSQGITGVEIILNPLHEKHQLDYCSK